MDKNAIIKQLQDAIDQLKRENESLKGGIKELEAKLAMHDDAHTPPSLKRGGKRKKDQNTGGGKKPGQERTYGCDETSCKARYAGGCHERSMSGLWNQSLLFRSAWNRR